MAYYEHSGGDPRALEAAGRIVAWCDRLLSGKFSVGSWGGNGRFGAVEPLVAYAWRTKDPKSLALARRIADLNRASGGIAWMIRGEPATEHLHSCLTTVRGFPWLYAATGDGKYLGDATAACERIYDACTWANGCVAELLPPEAAHCFHTDETCSTADELMLSYHLADLTGEGRFFDRCDVLYYNAMRFHQWFNGNFNTYSDPYVGLKGPDNWWCCTWWGAKGLYETARHLVASSPTEVYVHGFMPSLAELPLGNGLVRIETQAQIPASGNVRMIVTPKGTGAFTLKVRIPGWAILRGVEINGQSRVGRPERGYLELSRDWHAGDCVDVHFDLPLRVVLDRGQGPTPIAEGKVSLDGTAPTPAPASSSTEVRRSWPSFACRMAATSSGRTPATTPTSSRPWPRYPTNSFLVGRHIGTSARPSLWKWHALHKESVWDGRGRRGLPATGRSADRPSFGLASRSKSTTRQRSRRRRATRPI